MYVSRVLSAFGVAYMSVPITLTSSWVDSTNIISAATKSMKSVPIRLEMATAMSEKYQTVPFLWLDSINLLLCHSRLGGDRGGNGRPVRLPDNKRYGLCESRSCDGVAHRPCLGAVRDRDAPRHIERYAGIDAAVVPFQLRLKEDARPAFAADLLHQARH